MKKLEHCFCIFLSVADRLIKPRTATFLIYFLQLLFEILILLWLWISHLIPFLWYALWVASLILDVFEWWFKFASAFIEDEYIFFLLLSYAFSFGIYYLLCLHILFAYIMIKSRLWLHHTLWIGYWYINWIRRIIIRNFAYG